MSRVTSAGSRSAARPTQKTPAVQRGTTSAAASIATGSPRAARAPSTSRDVRRPRLRERTSSSSRARPTKELAGRGQVRVRDRLEAESPRPRAGRSPPGRSRFLEPVLAEILSSACTRPAVASRGRPGPHAPAAATRAATCTSAPTYPSHVARSPPVCRPARTPNRACGQGLGHPPRRRHRARRGREGEEEPVTLRVHLDSVLRGARRPDRPSDARRAPRRTPPSRARAAAGRAFDVGEEECDGAGRELGPHRSSDHETNVPVRPGVLKGGLTGCRYRRR